MGFLLESVKVLFVWPNERSPVIVKLESSSYYTQLAITKAKRQNFHNRNFLLLGRPHL